MMADRPILFSAPMVRALLDDIAAYLRWEAATMRDGGWIGVSDREYSIRTVADVAAYLDAEYPLEAAQ